MKKWMLFVLIVTGAMQSGAQQRPQYTQYIFNNYLLNPAVAGIENYIDVKAGYRNQWSGLDGAPVTSYISVNAPLGRDYLYSNANSMSGSGDNPMNRSFVQNYRAAEPHHGIGFHAVVDKTGPISRTDFNATYAYHIGLSNTLNVSMGVSLGLSRISLDVSKITLETSLDPAISQDQSSQNAPDAGLGLWLYGPQFFAGASVQQLLGREVSFSDDAAYNQGKQVPHYFATAGYKIFLAEDIAAIPSIMVKYVSPAPTSVDANLKLAFRDKFWLGGSYRKNDSFSALAGFNLGYLFSLSYSYDFTTSDLRTVSNGTHEFVLGILLNNRYRVTCPQRTF